MPSVVQTQTVSSVGFMLKDRPGESIAPAFTAVNGHSSPTTPRRLNGTNAMTVDTVHVRTLPHAQADKVPDQKALPLRQNEWALRHRPTENGTYTGHHSGSPPFDDPHRSPNSPSKRKRSSSLEEDDSSPDSAHGQRRPRLDSYVVVAEDHSSNPVSRAPPDPMEHPRPRTLPPLERPEHERGWPSRDLSNTSPTGYAEGQGRDYHQHEGAHDDFHAYSDHMERSSTMEITRSGVQVDPKKRKRQFANRTKTGCGTCRRRKKKCDEGKPECQNCNRGGFFCEGYQPKIPWPKNGVNKPHLPAIQSKDRYPEGVQLYHSSHGTRPDSYPEPGQSQTDDARTRPIVVVEEQDHQAQQPQRNGWGNYKEPRPSYAPEHSQAPEYNHPPQTASHPAPPTNEHHVPHHPVQAPPPPRPHNQRVYHHTPQSMNQVAKSPPPVMVEAPPHHQPQPAAHQAPPGPPGPPPTHYPRPPPPPRPRSEKEKMLSSEPFLPYCTQLIEERFQCKKRLHQFHTTSNPANHISLDSRLGIFRAVAELRYRSPEQTVDGHVGSEVFVETPFNCDYGYNLDIGDMVIVGSDCKFLDSAKITIGRNTRIGANVTIDTQTVPTNSKSLKGSRGTVVAAEVVVGENVYIGPNVTILAGVKIGNGAIIHPGAVVVRDIPRDCVARGNPAEIRSVNWEE